ncbi:transposase [Streptomyces chartreusis]|uniref:transposase n=1 Tax=Streptomyces chartreusis TaxID=1969 RepID=UPI003719BFAF
MRTSREKDADHRALHLPARGRDGRLRRRARTGDPPHVPAGAGLVAGRPPHQVRSGLRPRTGEDVGLRRLTCAGRTRGHHDRLFPQQCLLPAVSSEGRGSQSHGDIYVVTDNLSSHNSLSTRTWLEDHPRIRHVFIPVGACWLNLQEGWWRIFRKAALAGQSFAGPAEIEHATRLATSQLNTRARPWVWGRPAPSNRLLRRRYVYIQ